MAGSRPFSAAPGVASDTPGFAGSAAPARESFAGRPGWWRWHALLGAVPLAGYLVLHLGAQAWALSAGPELRALEDAWQRPPFWDVLALLFVGLPLAAHVLLGLRRVLSSERAEPHWPAPLGRLLQRVSAGVLLLFLLGHVWHLPGRRWLGELERRDYFAELCSSLSSTAWGGVPLVAVGYLLGMAAAALHLWQGLYHTGLSSGLVAEAGRLRLSRACWACGVFTFAVGALIVVRLATGSLDIGLSGAPTASQ